MECGSMIVCACEGFLKSVLTSVLYSTVWKLLVLLLYKNYLNCSVIYLYYLQSISSITVWWYFILFGFVFGIYLLLLFITKSPADKKNLVYLTWQILLLQFRVWESLSATTCSRSLVVVHGGYCLLQIGIAAESLTEVGEAVTVDVHKLIQSSVYRSVMESRKRRYHTNMLLWLITFNLELTIFISFSFFLEKKNRELFGKPLSLSCKIRVSLLTY